ncbi:hypothetical protein ACX3V1_03370, partial [Escherichia coli]
KAEAGIRDPEMSRGLGDVYKRQVELNLEPSQVGNEFAEKYYGPASQVVPEFVEKLLKGL